MPEILHHEYSTTKGRAEAAAQRIVIAALEGGTLDLSNLGATLEGGATLGKFLGDVTNALTETLLKKT